MGDPKNFNCFMNVSTDSYAATIGSDGDFTGACTHLGYICFFKEDMLHRVYGSQPSNFTTTSTPCRGVEKGSEKSLVIVNEYLYYKSRTSICVYDGSLPSEISAALGETRYTGAVAGALGNKYYVSMADSAGLYHLFVYDTSLGMWHKEDNTQALFFAAHEGELFYIDADTENIMTVNGRLSVHEGGEQYDEVNGAAEDDFDWFVETGEIGHDLPEYKYISRIMIRMAVAPTAVGDEEEPEHYVNVDLKYDSGDTWDEHEIKVYSVMRTITLIVVPRRCDHMRIKISGTGGVKIYSYTKTIESSDADYED